jgi:hypothetical protein
MTKGAESPRYQDKEIKSMLSDLVSPPGASVRQRFQSLLRCFGYKRDQSASKPAPPRQVWYIDNTLNQKEALGFLKDWASTVLSLQTTLIAAIAAFVGIKGVSDFKQLRSYEAALLVFAVASSLYSIYAGMTLLNMLPGAAQRRPEQAERQQDIYSIYTSGTKTILYWVVRFRRSFLVTMFFLVAFVSAVVIMRWFFNPPQVPFYD